MKARWVVAYALASVIVVGAGRQLLVGNRAITLCDAAVSRGDAREAIAQARRAAEALLPGSPYARQGYERLARIAKDAEARGDSATAAAAWRAVRAAAMETRAVGSGSASRIAAANAGLVRAAAHDVPIVSSLPEALAREDGPATWELLLMAVLATGLYIVGARAFSGKRA